MYNFERNLEAKQTRRMKAQDRFLSREEKREASAEKMIGELCRKGETVYYVFPVGGKYKESSSFFELVDYLKRNRYV